MSKSVRAWLQLLRAPNLFTVPGDPIAGFLLATYGGLDWRVLAPISASLCFYAAGLLMNDLSDLEEDRRERPSRPLPSGAVELESVRTVCGALSLGGVVILAIWANLVAAGIGAGLLVFIGLYNRGTKHIAGIGAINMGLCRALSLALGAAAANPFFLHRAPGVWDAGLALFLYIAAVTVLASFETRKQAPIAAVLLPGVAALIGVAAMLHPAAIALGGFDSVWRLVASSEASLRELRVIVGPVSPLLYAPAILVVGFLAAVAETIKLLGKDPPPLPPSIGSLIRLLLVFQASFCVIYGFGWDGRIAALVLVGLLPLAGMASRRFYGS